MPASQPTPKPKQTAESFLTPGSFIRAAKDAHPAFRYALVIAGVGAIIVIFRTFRVDWATLVFGILAVFALIAVFLVVAQVPRIVKARMARPALFFVWSVLIVAIAIIVCLTSSAFFDQPLPFKTYILRLLDPPAPISMGPVTQPPVKPPVDPPVVSPPAPAVDTDRVAAEISAIYQDIGHRLSRYENWANTPWRATLRSEPGKLFITPPDGVTQSMAIDPADIPRAEYTTAHLADLEARGIQISQPVAEFLAANETFKIALDNLGRAQPSLQDAYGETTLEAQMTLTRGRVALCALGKIPPEADPIGALIDRFPPRCTKMAH